MNEGSGLDWKNALLFFVWLICLFPPLCSAQDGTKRNAAHTPRGIKHIPDWNKDESKEIFPLLETKKKTKHVRFNAIRALCQQPDSRKHFDVAEMKCEPLSSTLHIAKFHTWGRFQLRGAAQTSSKRIITLGHFVQACLSAQETGGTLGQVRFVSRFMQSLIRCPLETEMPRSDGHQTGGTI